jgi:hypothetical protein
MSSLATWLAARRARRVVIIAGLFPLPFLGLISAATVVMTAILRGPREALIDCLAALVMLIGLGYILGLDLPTLVLSAGSSWVVWIGLGALAGWSKSLALTVQSAVLLALAGLLVFLAAIDDPGTFWVPMLEAWYADLSSQGLEIQADVGRQALLMSGGLFAFMLTGCLLALMLGMHWAAAVMGGEFGTRFRELRLGYIVGGLAAVIGLLGLAGFELSGALLIFGVAFTLQGVAVLAWWAGRLNWPRGWWLGLCLAPVLFVGLLVIELALLAAIGFVDNWYGLRKVRLSNTEK